MKIVVKIEGVNEFFLVGKIFVRKLFVEDVLMVVMVDMVADAWVVIGKEIEVVKIVDENYLTVVKVVEKNCSLNLHTYFGTHHRLGFDHRA